MINLLPKWVIPNSNPSIYDTESVTVLEAVSKLQGKMNELIEDYNAFVEKWNKQISEFEYSTREELEIFEKSMRQEFQDFIDIVNIKIQNQDNEISNVVNQLNSEFEAMINEKVNQAVATAILGYDEENEEIIVGGES